MDVLCAGDNNYVLNHRIYQAAESLCTQGYEERCTDHFLGRVLALRPCKSCGLMTDEALLISCVQYSRERK